MAAQAIAAAAPAASSTSSRAASAASAKSIRLHDLCATPRPARLARRHARVGHRARAQHRTCRRCPNFTLPGDIAASKRYFVPDLIEPPIEVRPDGTIPVPDAPGIGVTIVPARVDAATERQLELDPSSFH